LRRVIKDVWSVVLINAAAHLRPGYLPLVKEAMPEFEKFAGLRSRHVITSGGAVHTDSKEIASNFDGAEIEFHGNHKAPLEAIRLECPEVGKLLALDDGMRHEFVIIFQEVFAGSAVLTAACQRVGVGVLPPFDIAMDPSMDYSVVGRRLVRDPAVCPWFAPPCQTFSIARTTANVSRRRSLEEPWAPEDDVEGVKADILFTQAIEDCIWVHKQGRPFALEHPWSAYSWSLPITKQLLELPGVVRVKVVFCAFGALYQKPTGLATNVLALAELGVERRPCVHPLHEMRLQGSETAKAAEYPRDFARAAARILHRELPKWGVSRQKGASPVLQNGLEILGVVAHVGPDLRFEGQSAQQSCSITEGMDQIGRAHV
jgi:hypothetical protein